MLLFSLFLLFLLTAVVIALLVTYKPLKNKKNKCDTTADCPSNSKCQSGECQKREGHACKKGGDCSDGMSCLNAQCKHTDFVNKNKRVRFVGESRRQASKRRQASNPETGAPRQERYKQSRHLDVRTQDVSRPAPEPKTRGLVGVYDEHMQSILPVTESTELADLTMQGEDLVCLTKRKGNLIFQQQGQTPRVVECKQHMEKITSYNGRLLGVGDGILHEFVGNDWKEVSVPTRQILHWSSSGDGKALCVRDLDYEYVFDGRMNITKEGPSDTLRFYGRDASEYMQVNEATGHAVTSDGTEMSRNITSAAFAQEDKIFVVDDEKRKRGVQSVHVFGDKIFYLAKV